MSAINTWFYNEQDTQNSTLDPVTGLFTNQDPPPPQKSATNQKPAVRLHIQNIHRAEITSPERRAHRVMFRLKVNLIEHNAAPSGIFKI